MRLFLQKFFTANLLFSTLLFSSLFSGEIAFGASSSASIDYEKASASYYSFFQSKKSMDRRDKWVSVIQKFDLIYKNYFPSSEAYKAVFTAGDLYEQLYAISRRDEDLDAALQYYEKNIKEFQPGRLTDDALYRQGEIFFSRKKYNAALASFEKILKILPNGDVAAKAKARITNIRSFVHPPIEKQKLTKKKQTGAYSVENSNSIADKELILEKIDYTVGLDSVRVVAHTSNAVTFSQGRLSSPERVYINFNDTLLANSVARNIKIGSRFLNGLRLSQFDKKNTRLVFDLNEASNLKVGVWLEGSSLIVHLSNKNRLIAQAVSKPVVSKPVVSKPVVSVTRKTVKANKKTEDNLAPRKATIKVSKKRSFPVINTKRPLIVVDAGHGGKDLGAKGNRGLLEKDVNLAIALRLKDILRSRYKYRVILTRKNDEFISLPGRGKIANDNSADVFVSVHANAAPRRGAHGIETYYLGSGHSENAKATAARENGELVKSVADDQTQEILASMISTTKINKSSRLASNIQSKLYQSMKKKYSGIKDLGVKEGPFFVLHDTNMASVLIEVGFLTNLKEENRLKQDSYLDRLASSIAKGIAKFVQEYDPMI